MERRYAVEEKKKREGAYKYLEHNKQTRIRSLSSSSSSNCPKVVPEYRNRNLSIAMHSNVGVALCRCQCRDLWLRLSSSSSSSSSSPPLSPKHRRHLARSRMSDGCVRVPRSSGSPPRGRTWRRGPTAVRGLSATFGSSGSLELLHARRRRTDDARDVPGQLEPGAAHERDVPRDLEMERWVVCR